MEQKFILLFPWLLKNPGKPHSELPGAHPGPWGFIRATGRTMRCVPKLVARCSLDSTEPLTRTLKIKTLNPPECCLCGGPA